MVRTYHSPFAFLPSSGRNILFDLVTGIIRCGQRWVRFLSFAYPTHDAGTAHTVSLGNACQTHASHPVLNETCMVYIERLPPYRQTFQLSAADTLRHSECRVGQ